MICNNYLTCPVRVLRARAVAQELRSRPDGFAAVSTAQAKLAQCVFLHQQGAAVAFWRYVLLDLLRSACVTAALRKEPERVVNRMQFLVAFVARDMPGDDVELMRAVWDRLSLAYRCLWSPDDAEPEGDDAEPEGGKRTALHPSFRCDDLHMAWITGLVVLDGRDTNPRIKSFWRSNADALGDSLARGSADAATTATAAPEQELIAAARGACKRAREARKAKLVRRGLW